MVETRATSTAALRELRAFGLAYPAAHAMPIDMRKAWIDEGDRAQAPKRLVVTIGR
ncbi:MAG TPA: hypothetical protein VL624_21740 [Caldimonas sp.]|jgi:hypothetical protein|nr:hypothetical protein [Caldimonas sp.]